MKDQLTTMPLGRALARLASLYLKDAAGACRRLADPADAEALHDFRVALRRLRSLLRAYRPWLGDALPRKLRRRLRKLVRRTGPARDAEVQLAWLRAAQPDAGEAEGPGVQWLVDDLAARRDAEYHGLRAALPAAFPRLRQRLRVRLAHVADTVTSPFGAAAAQRLREAADDLQAHLAQVQGAADEAEIHRARIAGKRLRYLLEPLAGALPGGKALVKELRALQDCMGAIHDHQVLGAELLRAAERAGAARLRRLVEASLRDEAEPRATREDGDETAGFLWLGRRLRSARREGITRLLDRLAAGDLARFLDHLQGACDRLEGLTAPAGEAG